MSAAGTEICVAVATRGRPERLARLLDSLADQSLDPSAYEIVVAIDGADPASEAVVAERALASRAAIRSVVLERPEARRAPATPPGGPPAHR